MCSACSGDYEGRGDGWELPPANSSDELHGGLRRTKSIRPAVCRTQNSGHEHDHSRKREPAGEVRDQSAYEVLVSAEEIIEIHRIAADFEGAP
jgi:hypothetical protein